MEAFQFDVPISLVIFIVVRCMLYRSLRSWRQRIVSLHTPSFVHKANNAENDKAFGDKHACMPMETWIPYKWPLALDILKRQYDALAKHRLLSFQTEYFDRLGPNMTFRLLGSQGYFTADPKNVESILSTNFEGSVP